MLLIKAYIPVTSVQNVSPNALWPFSDPYISGLAKARDKCNIIFRHYSKAYKLVRSVQNVKSNAIWPFQTLIFLVWVRLEAGVIPFLGATL